jgi:hypothetical protein
MRCYSWSHKNIVLLAISACLAVAATACKGDDPSGPVCGNGYCESGESAASCPADCHTSAVCGNGSCESGESTASCPADCGGGGTASVLLQNTSSYSVWYFYIAACGTESWGPDQLGASTIPSGSQGTVSNIPPGCYGLWATGEDGYPNWLHDGGVTLTGGSTYTWTLTD